MPPMRAEELAAVCRQVDASTVAGFVSELEEARGRAVERGEDATFAVVRDGGRERVMVAGGDADPAGADAVVVAGLDDPRIAGLDDPRIAGLDDPEVVGARVIDAQQLAHALLYAVDRSTADDLMRRWFDRPLASFEGTAGVVDGSGPQRPSSAAATAGPGGSRRGADRSPPHRSPPARGGRSAPAMGDGGASERNTSGRLPAPLDEATTAGAVVVTTLLVVAAVVAGWPGGVLPGEALLGPGDDVGGAGTETPASSPAVQRPDDTGDPAGAGAADSPSADDVANASRPPGVAPNGSIDEDVLLSAHRARLANTSYRITLTAREFVDGTETALLWETVLVENATTYHVRSKRIGTFRTSPPTFEYAAEGTRFGGERVDARPEGSGTDPFLDDLVRYLSWYLSVEESRIADVRAAGETRTFWLVSRGDPYPGVENATGSALVTDSGLVRSVHRAYGVPDSPVRVVVTIRVSDVGRTNVTATE